MLPYGPLGYYRESSEGMGCLLWIFAAAALAAFVYFMADAKGVDNTVARMRFARQIGVEVSAVRILNQSNADAVTGDPYDVTYELQVMRGDSAEYVSGRCYSGWLTPQVCRLYGD